VTARSLRCRAVALPTNTAAPKTRSVCQGDAAHLSSVAVPEKRSEGWSSCALTTLGLHSPTQCAAVTVVADWQPELSVSVLSAVVVERLEPDSNSPDDYQTIAWRNDQTITRRQRLAGCLEPEASGVALR
jgi:hypothetical protein